jgi:hypothetical protein
MKESDSPSLDFAALLKSEQWPEEEEARLVRLMRLFAELPNPPDPVGLFPNYTKQKERFLTAAQGNDPEALEESFLELYCHVHGYEAPYTRQERCHVNETGGYWCHAGGLSPILKAEPYLGPGKVSGDFGAGNGLQMLLMQKLYPHVKTVMVEISSRMVEAGRQLQSWLDIPKDRVEWVIGDVGDVSPAKMDFVYIYRPVRPEGPGRQFYERFSKELGSTAKPVVIFSIADCLRSFLPSEFEVFYSDGHLTCFRKRT